MFSLLNIFRKATVINVLPTRKYKIEAKLRALPVSRMRCFDTFVVESTSLYNAFRKFDQEYPLWRRLGGSVLR